MAKQAIKSRIRTSKKTVPTKKTVRKKTESNKLLLVKTPEEKEAVSQSAKTHKSRQYLFSIGRRKSSIARARFYSQETPEIRINGKQLSAYFGHFEYQQIVNQPLRVTNLSAHGLFDIKLSGGGLRGQAESARLAISRILLQQDSSLKPLLKAHGLLVRDSRVKERKKYGLKSARRAPQWQKR